VLASLLGWVSANRDPVTGGSLLLVYSCGYVAPLLVAASATVRRGGRGSGTLCVCAEGVCNSGVGWGSKGAADGMRWGVHVVPCLHIVIIMCFAAGCCC
jgi:hypothetical protein